jgi:hypothetical protein
MERLIPLTAETGTLPRSIGGDGGGIGRIAVRGCN